MKTRGFTLLELLVAVTITLLLAGLTLSVTTNLLAQMHQAQGASATAIEGKLALDQIERDLQGTVLRNDGKSWLDLRVLTSADLAAHGWQTQAAPPFKPVTESTAFLPDAALDGGTSIVRARFGIAGVWLRLLTSDYDSASSNTVPLAVSYQVARKPVSSASGAPVRYGLYRTKMTATNSFNNVLGVMFTSSAPSGLTSPASDEVLASNVVDFGVWVYSRDINGRLSTTPLFPTGRTATVVGTFPSLGQPAAAEVMVRILTEEGATLIQAMEEGRVTQPPGISAGQWWWQVAEANSHVFIRHVEFAAAAP